MDRRGFLSAATAYGFGSLLAGCGDGEDAGNKKTEPLGVIRLAPHGAWGSTKANGVMGILQSKAYLEKEFEADGVRIEWRPMDGGGIGINEAIANGLVDASSFGVFPQIVGRSRGIQTRLIASQGFNSSYFAVPSRSAVRTPYELQGATLAVGLGGFTHHSTSLLLKEHGLQLSDVKLVNMETKDAVSALAAGRIDGYLGGPALFSLEEQGIVRIIYATKGRETPVSAFGGVFVTKDFAERYPDATRRIAKAYIRAVHWVSLPENREAYFEYNAANTTVPLKYWRRDYEGRELREAFNPVIDDYYLARLRETTAFCVENKIIRQPIDIEAWVDRETNTTVLAELGLSNYFSSWDAAGRPTHPPAVATAESKLKI